MKTLNERARNAIWGAIIGDSMGMPFEWMKREDIEIPSGLVPDERRGYPVGAWSDDSSMILCTIDSLVHNGWGMRDLGDTFVNKWYDSAYWTPFGRVFDIGNTTRYAMESIKNGEYVNGCCERDKGNGSLMRILPMACYLADEDIFIIKNMIEECSALTHSTKECKIACVWYSLLVKYILKGVKGKSVITFAEQAIRRLYEEELLSKFERILSDKVLWMKPEELKGTGYVIYSLEVVINCLFNGKDLIHAIQRAIAVGGDTDTNASLVAGLFALDEEVPEEMKNQIIKKDEIEELINKVDWSWGR